MNSPLANCWYAVATVDSIGDTPVSAELRDTSYVVWRTPDQQLTAAVDRCSHREARLSRGTIEDGCLRCPYHGWTFADEGRCVAVPSSGVGATIPPGAHLTPLAVEEHHGLVWLCPGEPTSPVPFINVDHDTSFTRLNTSMQVWSCAATRMIDNMLDVAHFPYTHAGTFGREQEQEVPKYSLTQLDDTFHGYEYSVVINNEGEAKTMSGSGDDIIRLDMSTGFALPFSVRSTMSYENGIEQVLFMTASPMKAATTTSPAESAFTFVLWRNDDVTETGQGIVDFELEVACEDQRTLENLSGELPLEHGVLVDVASDKASLEWRRQLKALIDSANS